MGLPPIHRLNRRAGENDGIADHCNAGSVDLTCIVGCGRVSRHITDRFAPAIGTDSSKAVTNLIIVGVVGVVRLPLDILECQGSATLSDAFWQMVEVLVRQIGVGSGGCDRLGAAAIASSLGLDAVQIKGEGTGKPFFRGDLLLLGQQ